MILAGELDHGGNEDDLAVTLGFSARHLRRLFNEVLGITPDGLARSARTQYARRLLGDTDLSITEIAHTTGFGSVRQLNRAVQELFHTTPGRLRIKLREKDRLVAGCGLFISLRSLRGLDWPVMLDYLAARAIPGVAAVEDQTFRRTIEVDGGPGVIEVFPRRDVDSLFVCFHLPHWLDIVHLMANVRRLVPVNLPLRAAHDASERRSELGSLLDANPELRSLGCWDAFEQAVLELVTQDVGATAAREALAELARRFGRDVPGLAQLGLNWLFPTPTELADAVDCDFPAGAPIRALATALRDGRIHLDGSVPLEPLIENLAQLPGFDHRLAQCVAFCTGETETFPTIPEATKFKLFRQATG